MKGYRIFAALCLALGLVLGGFTVWLSLDAPKEVPVILELDPAAGETADAFLQEVSRGELDLAGEKLLGAPVLSGPAENETDPAWLLWSFYYSHMICTPQGEPYAGRGLQQDAVVSVPDLNAITERIGTLAPGILQQRIESAEDVSEIYDETNSYRRELTDWVLLEATRQALTEPVTQKEQKLSLQLVYDGGQWKVRPDQALLELLSGGLEKG